VVRAGLIVGQSPSHVVLHQDPTAHAEMEAIRDAARRLGTRNLSGCTLYSSSPPCPMCTAGQRRTAVAHSFVDRTANQGAGLPTLLSSNSLWVPSQ
jgi:tRNA(Arg) A34 adenosine deaminase TadA